MSKLSANSELKRCINELNALNTLLLFNKKHLSLRHKELSIPTETMYIGSIKTHCKKIYSQHFETDLDNDRYFIMP